MSVTQKLFAGIAVSLALISASAAPVHAAEPLAAGLWEQTGDDGKVGGWFLFFERDGLYEGALVRIFQKPGEPSHPVCDKCTDERKNVPMLGLVIVKDMQRKGLAYESGNILDPRDGSVYKAKMELSRDGKSLTVRGFLGIELFGQSQVWKRLPDTALARNEIPENLQPYMVASPASPISKPTPGTNPKPSPPVLRR
jgi:uncharacterized protein (DUF2147 family)